MKKSGIMGVIIPVLAFIVCIATITLFLLLPAVYYLSFNNSASAFHEQRYDNAIYRDVNGHKQVLLIVGADTTILEVK